MPCENYREALIDAAAADSTPPRELRLHMDACASCRTAFSEEQQLFAAIDGSLRVSTNATAPTSLFSRVRAHLMEQHVSHRPWAPVFAGVGIAATLVVALILARKPGRDGGESNPQMTSAARYVPPAENQPAASTVAPVEVARRARKHDRVGMVESAPAAVARSTEAEVLIPAGQKQAVDILLARLQRGEVKADVFLAERPEKPLKALEVSPLDISPIEIKPLSDVETKLATPDEKTGR
jgi:hypothetical protein